MTIKYQLLNDKVIQKTLTSHKFFNKFIFSYHIIHKSILYILNYDDLDVFSEQITNKHQFEGKHNITPFVYQPNCQNVYGTK